MKIGAHVSIAGGIENAPLNAQELGCECFQMFSRSPRGGPAKKIDKETRKKFLKNCQANNFQPGKDYIIHTPYFINLASENNRIYYGSIKAIREELEIASLIEAPFVILHLGSAKDITGDNKKEETNKKVFKAIKEIHKDYQGEALLTIEIAAGSGEIIGDTLEEIGYFIRKAEKAGIKLGFCFDTCHAFAAGYDLRTSRKVKQVFQEMENKIGLEKLKCVHFNDSQADFNSHKDRHEHLGEGKIGLNGLKEVIKIAKKQDLNLYIETKHDKIEQDLKTAKKMRA